MDHAEGIEHISLQKSLLPIISEISCNTHKRVSYYFGLTKTAHGIFEELKYFLKEMRGSEWGITPATHTSI